MAIQIQLRQGTTTEHNTFKGAVGEVTVDTTNKTLRVHDGVTAGGTPLLTANQLVDSTTTVKGVAKIATTAIAQEGTNDTDIITPAKLKGYLDTKVLGINQTWQNVTSSRLSGTVYTNTTGKTLIVKVSSGDTSSGNTMYLYVDGNEVQRIRNEVEFGSVNTWATLEVPSGATYQITSPLSFTNWSELR